MAIDLAIDDGGGGTGLSFALLAALHIQGMMDAIERAVVAPQVEIIEKRAAWRQILRDRSPLASRTQHIHDPVHHFAHVDVPSIAAAPGRWNQQFDVRPFDVGQIAREFAQQAPLQGVGLARGIKELRCSAFRKNDDGSWTLVAALQINFLIGIAVWRHHLQVRSNPRTMFENGVLYPPKSGRSLTSEAEYKDCLFLNHKGGAGPRPVRENLALQLELAVLTP